MVSDIVQPSNLKNAKSENGSQNGSHNVAGVDLNGRPKNTEIAGVGACSGGSCGQDTASGVFRESITNGTVQPNIECVSSCIWCSDENCCILTSI